MQQNNKENRVMLHLQGKMFSFYQQNVLYIYLSVDDCICPFSYIADSAFRIQENLLPKYRCKSLFSLFNENLYPIEQYSLKILISLLQLLCIYKYCYI